MVNSKISNRAKNLFASPIRKFSNLVSKLEKQGTQVIKLNIGNPDIQPPRQVIRALRAYNSSKLTYAPSNGKQEHIAAWLKYYADFGIKLKPDNLLPTIGASEAICFSLMALFDPGDEMLVFEPLYSNYKAMALMTNVKLKPVLLKLENNFALPAANQITKKITSRTKAILIINPDNPTGKVWQASELLTIAKIAKQHNLFIIADETYREIVFEGKFLSLLSFKQFRQRLVVIDSLSKRFSIPGLRIGAVVSFNKQFMQAVFKMAMVRLAAPSPGQLASVEILKNATAYTKKITAEYNKRKEIVNQILAQTPGIDSRAPAGAFYQVIRLPVKNSQKFINYLLTKFRYKNKTLLVSPMQDFYISQGLGKNEIRIAYMVGGQKLKLAMQIFKKALEAYRQK